MFLVPTPFLGFGVGAGKYQLEGGRREGGRGGKEKEREGGGGGGRGEREGRRRRERRERAQKEEVAIKYGT